MKDYTPVFLEPGGDENIGQTFRSLILDELKSPGRMASTCAYPECGEDRLYWGTPLCIEHAAVVWELFDEHEPALHKAHVREQYKAAAAKRAERARRKAEMRVTANHRPGHVYYLQVGDRIKIGFSTDLNRRMAQYPPNAQLLAAHPGTLAVEKDMHLRFDMYRTEGREWFSTADTLMAHIGDVQAKYPHHRERIPMRKANERKSTINARSSAHRV